MDISVIVPLYNEDESLEKLQSWIANVMDAHKFSYEILFVNNGSTDRSWEVIESLQKKISQRTRNQISQQLWQVTRSLLWFQSSQRQCGYYNGC